jgi:competence protein ComEC
VTIVIIVSVGGAECSGPAPTDDPGDTINDSDTPTAPAEGTLEVHYINVGQAASTLIISPKSETMLIDTGDFRTDGQEVLDYLKAQEIDRIDYLVTSHPDADHIGGHANLIAT